MALRILRPPGASHRDGPRGGPRSMDGAHVPQLQSCTSRQPDPADAIADAHSMDTRMAEYESRCGECGQLIERDEDIAPVEHWKGTPASGRTPGAPRSPAPKSTDGRPQAREPVGAPVRARRLVIVLPLMVGAGAQAGRPREKTTRAARRRCRPSQVTRRAPHTRDRSREASHQLPASLLRL